MKEAVAQYFDAIAIGADSTRAAAAYYLSLTKQCVLLLKQKLGTSSAGKCFRQTSSSQANN